MSIRLTALARTWDRITGQASVQISRSVRRASDRRTAAAWAATAAEGSAGAASGSSPSETSASSSDDLGSGSCSAQLRGQLEDHAFVDERERGDLELRS